MTLRVKIVHMTSVHVPFDSRIFHKECKTLARDHDVVLIAPHDRDEVVDDVTIRAIRRGKTRLQRMTVTAWNAYRAARKENGVIFHIHDPELLPWGQLLRLAGKFVVFDMHENLPKALLTKSWVPERLRPVASRFFKWFERRLMHRLPIVFAENSYVADYDWVKRKAVVLNMPLVPSRNGVESKYKSPTLAYIGSVTPERGFYVTLEAISVLKAQGYDVEWECIGPLHGIDEGELSNFLNRKKLTGVRLRGYLQPKEGQSLVSRCHIGLAVLQELPNYTESYPTKMFEYMALGLPVVASNFALYKRVIEEEHCGLTVDPHDPETLARAIRWLIEHPREAEQMGRNGMAAVHERYSWQTEGEKLLTFYRELASASVH